MFVYCRQIHRRPQVETSAGGPLTIEVLLKNGPELQIGLLQLVALLFDGQLIQHYLSTTNSPAYVCCMYICCVCLGDRGVVVGRVTMINCGNDTEAR